MSVESHKMRVLTSLGMCNAARTEARPVNVLGAWQWSAPCGERARWKLSGVGANVGSDLGTQPCGHDAATAINKAATERDAEVTSGVCRRDTLIDGVKPRIERT